MRKARRSSLAEQASMVHKGTLMAVGSVRAVVVATGAAMQIGQLSRLVEETESGETPLERRLDALGRRFVWVTLAVAAVVTGLGVFRGADLRLMIETGIALAIAAVSEGLPVVATITLAVGVRRMAKRRALVRRLPAVELALRSGCWRTAPRWSAANRAGRRTGIPPRRPC